MIGGGTALAAAFGGPIAALAKTAEYRRDCRPGAASPSVDTLWPDLPDR
jgi:hypothetical protein